MLHQNNYLAQLQNKQIRLCDIPKRERTAELCLAAVQLDGMALQYVPKHMRVLERCLIAVQQFGNALRYVPDDKKTLEICLAAVQNFGFAFIDVPKEKRTPKICLAAIQSGFPRDYLPADNLTPEIYLFLVQQKKLSLEDVPIDKRTPEICLTAIQQNELLFKYVPEQHKTQIMDQLTVERCLAVIRNDGLTLRYLSHDKQIPEKCLAAVQQNGLTLQYVSADKQTPEICLAAVQQNGLTLQYVSPDKQTLELCLAAIREKKSALQLVAADKKTPELYLALVQKNILPLQKIPLDRQIPEICLAAVEQNIFALKYVPEQHKAFIINQLTVPHFAKHFSLMQYFPTNPSYEKEIAAFLASIKYIMITSEDGDAEINDISIVYSNAKKRVGKTIFLTNEKDLNKLLLDLHRIQNGNDISLVLAGHGNAEARSLARMEVANIVNICKTNSQIKHIQLLSCNIAKAKMPAQEKEMIRNYIVEMERKKKRRYGLQYTLNAPANDAFLQKNCRQFCIDNHLDGVYILSKDKDNGYRLLAIKINKDNSQIREKVTTVPANRIANIDKIIHGKKGKSFKFPTKVGVKNTIRDKNVLLTPNELAALRSIAYEHDRFDPLHPKYKQDKTLYPFLATVNADVKDLQKSFMKKIADGIASEPAIDWEITIAGSTNGLYANTKENYLIVARTFLYHSFALFGSNKANIDQDKLKDERKKQINSMEDGTYQQNNTMAKYLRVQVTGKVR